MYANINRQDLVEAAADCLGRAQIALPPWVEERISKASLEEKNPVARSNLQAMLDNLRIAREQEVPICQDTGLAVFHLEIGQQCSIKFDVNSALAEAVRLATRKVPLRPNAVDPISRKNTGDNTGPGVPWIMTEVIEGETVRITAFPKGAGSENMSVVGMLNPADDPLDFVVREVAKRAANACPPLFLGIGIGGTFDEAAALAKRALLREPKEGPLEMGLLSRINALGIGPMGLGGSNTALGIRIETACCHTASLPVAVNFQCWANRSASALVREDGWIVS
ncbi:MAG: fumarate hydratase [Methanosaeta sp. PtaB.Bin039]|nr:MAG: fumarate hydratase [Methanosaeta sp. PtaB.Bin039]HOT07626.1 fumarate hydratase [Methanotrichaceae archaeon]HQF15674.1 fumarate hydratase [Methanotrichaceae archaeon]HQI90410.1 fumarate hydratase [Methanotrichaceae archaeon]HQJ28984.1 fumarate hydratase [Methanotrichaceae archaeon]